MDVQSVVCYVGEDEKGSRGLLSSVGLLSFERSNWFKAVIEEKSHHSSAFSVFQPHNVEGWVPEVTGRQDKEAQKSLEEKHLHLECPRVIFFFFPAKLPP